MCVCAFCFLQQAIFAVISVAPDGIRLSEDILARAIVSFYTSQKLVPAGISQEALEDWSEKMGFGLRKCTSKFRRLWFETPNNAKTQALKELKQRCFQAGLQPGSPTDSAVSEGSSRSASHEDLSTLAPADERPSFDWSGLQKRLNDRLGSKLLKVSTGKNKTEANRPVPTPARAKDDQLPQFVLDSLAKQVEPVAPFATTAGEEDECPSKPAKTEKSKTGKSAKAKASKTKKNKKKQKGEIAGPEVEEGLKLDEDPAGAGHAVATDQPPKQHGKPAVPCHADLVAMLDDPNLKYDPKIFMSLRRAFICEEKKKGVKHAEANRAWMCSNVRSDLLSQLPEKELKRRRFM